MAVLADWRVGRVANSLDNSKRMFLEYSYSRTRNVLYKNTRILYIPMHGFYVESLKNLSRTLNVYFVTEGANYSKQGFTTFCSTTNSSAQYNS